MSYLGGIEKVGMQLFHHFSWMPTLTVEANITSAITLSADWTNSSVILNYTLRPTNALPLNSQTLWWDRDHSIVYCFGGERSALLTTTPAESIWSFTPDSQGTGVWQETIGPTSNRTFPSSIIRPGGGSSVSDNRTSYYLGGYTSALTSSGANLPSGTRENSPGLLTFDFDNLTLSNSSNVANPQAHDNWRPPGSLLDVPSFGREGLLISFGDGTRGNYDIGPFNNITIYDKIGQRWYWQGATGNIPEPRTYYCAVGVWDDANESFEM